MRSRREIDERAESRFVSTGQLPPDELVPALLSLAHELYGSNTEGANSQVYPALARVPGDLFGICVVGTSGNVYAAGDAEVEFTLMSISKPFVFALVCEALGPDRARDTLGVNATGLPFNSVTAIEQSPDGRTNPMVNPGAIATTSLVPGESADAKWRLIHEGLSRFAGRSLSLDADMYASASATNQRNQDIARAAADLRPNRRRPGRRHRSLHETVLPERQRQGPGGDGRNARRRRRQSPHPASASSIAETCRYTLAVMTTAGLYETSGDWLYDVGLPGKSGIGGGIVTVSPGKGGLGTFAPLLDDAGNSVKGQLAARFLSRRLGLDLFASAPEP